MQPLQHRKVPAFSCRVHSSRGPLWRLLVQPLHHRKVAIERCRGQGFTGYAGIRIIGKQPLHQKQVASARSSIHRFKAPNTVVVVSLQPLHYRQVTATCCLAYSHYGAPFCAIFMQPLHHRQMATTCCQVHGFTGAAFRTIVMQPFNHLKIPSRCCQVHGFTGTALGTIVMQPFNHIKMPSRCCYRSMASVVQPCKPLECNHSMIGRWPFSAAFVMAGHFASFPSTEKRSLRLLFGMANLSGETASGYMGDAFSHSENGSPSTNRKISALPQHSKNSSLLFPSR
mmetsp:Transcript_29958/g.51752  ORF Transcript_29958/g.51752 Transcript_29958/m.51752 type:complete len:284 (+) Transcript_29958:560-1411(+)